MESRDDSDAIIYWFNDLEGNRAEIPSSLRVSGIHRAVLEGNIDNVVRCIESGESVNKKESKCNFSPLHLSVIKDDINILECLLTEKGVEVDSRCSKGRTPLYLATSLGNLESVKRLIEAGADVNAPNEDDDKPLHVSVYHPDVCRLLLRHSAVITTDNKSKNTLHKAVAKDCLEVVHMLLYYNIDANAPDIFNYTPFMTALYHGKEEAQEILLEYVDDFDRMTDGAGWFGLALSFALQNNSPFTKEIIARGADVNYADNPRVRDEFSAFSACFVHPVDVDTFRMVWERLRYNDGKNTIDLLDFLDYGDEVPTFLPVIIESDNFEVAVEYFSAGENYLMFAYKYARRDFDLEQLTALTCRLLQYGFRASTSDICAIFSHYGYCELFRMLLYMDNDLTREWSPDMALPRLIFDIDFDLGSIVDAINDIPKVIMVQLLQYSICSRLIDALTVRYREDKKMSTILSRLPRMPSLIELARNAARKQIWQSFRVANTCQFYTIIDHLDIPSFCKNLLTFKRKIYSIRQ